MSVTIKTAPHAAEKVSLAPPASDADSFFRNDLSFQRSASKVLGSTFNPSDYVHYRVNGLVHTVIEAYSHHYNLVIRPDDVWIAIVSQLSFHIKANAEELRKKFVAHEAKKQLVLYIPPTSLDGIDWDAAGEGMANLLDENLVDKEFKELDHSQFFKHDDDR